MQLGLEANPWSNKCSRWQRNPGTLQQCVHINLQHLLLDNHCRRSQPAAGCILALGNDVMPVCCARHASHMQQQCRAQLLTCKCRQYSADYCQCCQAMRLLQCAASAAAHADHTSRNFLAAQTTTPAATTEQPQPQHPCA